MRGKHWTTGPLDHSTTLLVGVGGSAGSGKSTFVKELARLGARTIDADRIGWELLEPGTPTARRVIKAFGSGILKGRGTVKTPGHLTTRLLDHSTTSVIDRKKLGAIVFARPAARLRLNRIVHPALLGEIEKRIGRFRRNSECGMQNAECRSGSSFRNRNSAIRIVVIDAALLFLWNWQRKVHIAVLITSTRANKLRRLTGHGLTLTAARNRLASQLSEAEVRPKADLTIPNNGTIAELRVRARRFYRLLQSEL